MFIFNPMSKTNKTIIPPTLKKGDQVAIIATARMVSLEFLLKAEETLSSWGLVCIRGENLLKEHHQYAGTDSERQKDLHWAMDDINIKAIICFRGGYGSVRLLKEINTETLLKSPKWIIGYSDITALHLFAHAQINIASIHGTMPINFSENTSEALNTLKALIFGDKYEISAAGHSNNRFGVAKAEIIGGNLAIIQSLMGTPFEIETKGKILFLEDIDEYLYNIDRMMWTLKLSGKLDQLAGLIVGGMTDMNDNNIPFGASAYDSIKEKVKEYDYPICFNFPSGHINDNRAIPFGIPLKLAIDKKGVSLK